MHEYSIVQSLVERLLSQSKAAGNRPVTKIHLRRGSTFAEAPLRQSFQILTENTPLKSAELVIEEFSVRHTCRRCGRTHEVMADDLIGHTFVCPDCGQTAEIEEAHGLELVKVE